MKRERLIQRRIPETRMILEKLDFDPDRTNERSALVCLALLGLTPEFRLV